MAQGSDRPRVDAKRIDGHTVRLEFSGVWKLGAGVPSPDVVIKEIRAVPQCRAVVYDTEALADWDSGFVSFIKSVQDFCLGNRIETAPEGLPRGVGRLLSLASAVPEKKDAARGQARKSLFEVIGEETLELVRSSREMVTFIGEAALAFGRLVAGRARFRRVDFFALLQDCGARALPIVSLISVLVGLILAFVGAVQLRLFGAQIYVADLVGLGMAREMGAMMTAVIMAGRTGAAFAAQLGTMQVNEEIDALETLGISPMEFLVLPRMISLALMMPLLCLYADLMGILGGAVVGISMLT